MLCGICSDEKAVNERLSRFQRGAVRAEAKENKSVPRPLIDLPRELFREETGAFDDRFVFDRRYPRV